MSADRATCTDCGREVRWSVAGRCWRHTDDGSRAYGLDGHVVHADKVPVTNPACPCWSGYHFLHRPVCGCREGCDAR